jgi:hypothetical protein
MLIAEGSTVPGSWPAHNADVGITRSISTQFVKSPLRSTMTLSQVFVSCSMPWDPRVSGRGLRFRLRIAKHTGAFSFQ